MVVFDCERMKHPNTGLYVFCDNVAGNLVKQKASLIDGLGFFAPAACVGRWGENVAYMAVRQGYKVFMPRFEKVRVWHSAYQLTRYIPPKPIRQILTVHDLNFLYEKPKYKHDRYLWALQKHIDRADYIVAISESTKLDLMNNVDLRGKYVEVVYNGLNHFAGDIVPPGKVPQGKFLFTVGTVLPKKNFHVLPSLLTDNEYSLIIAGNRSAYADRIMEEAEKWGVSSRVHIVGPVPESVKFWYIKNCSAFMFPSVAEGFGLPVIEAMYYQKPIFLSDHTALPEIGGPDAFYFDHDFNPDIMRQQFRTGMEAYEKGVVDMESMKNRALSFSWERTARRYIEIYNELSAGGGNDAAVADSSARFTRSE